MIFEKIKLFVYKIFPSIKKYKLKRINKYLEPFGLEKYILNFNSFEENNDIKTLTYKKDIFYKTAYEKFKKVLELNFDSTDLHNFYYNSEWVKVHKFIPNPFTYTIGYYDSGINKLKYRSISLYHELFHLASTNNEIIPAHCGFEINEENKSIGYALNEGYTDLLAERYFNEDIEDSYYEEAQFARSIERIIGRKKMEKLYLNADIIGLINELKKYYSIDEIEQFLINMDVILKVSSSYMIDDEIIKINLLVEECICFLLKGFCKVMKNSNCSLENKKKQILDFYNNNQLFYGVSGNTFEINIDKINKIVNDNLNENIIIEFDEEKQLKKK